MEQPLFIGSRIYRGSVYGAQHPLSIQRVPALIDLSRALGWLPERQYRTSPRAKPAALAAFHDQTYIAALLQAEQDGRVSDAVRARHGLGTLSNPVFPEMFRRPATAAGGGLLAADLVAKGGVVYNPGGGTHHGLRDRAAGFCYLNEPVLTILRLRDLGLGPVVYIDIDAHHGDGVELAFAGARDVRMISVHEAGRWPFTGALDDTAGGAAFNLPVAKGFDDTGFALVLNELILPAVAAFRPGAIYLQCGADALAEDPLSRLGLSNNAHVAAVRGLSELAPRLIVAGGGGYNPWSTARCWTRVWGTLAGHETPEALPEKALAVLAGLSWSRQGRPGPDLLTTLADTPRQGPIPEALRADVAALRARI